MPGLWLVSCFLLLRFGSADDGGVADDLRADAEGLLYEEECTRFRGCLISGS